VSSVEAVSRLYVLGCVSSIFAPTWAVIEWVSHWLTTSSHFLRLLTYILLSAPLILLSSFVTSFVILATVAIFQRSTFSLLVSLIMAFMPWAVGYLTCSDHWLDFPTHYSVALGLTAIVYGVESVSWARSRRQDVRKSLQRS
jgi:hypothetical protein